MVICANCLYSLDFSNHSGFFFRAQTFWNGSFCLELVQDLCSRKFAAWGLAKHVCHGILQVPVAAAVYYEDMYVNFNIAKETASQIAGIRLWVTNEYMHSGLRDGGPHVFEHLMGLLNGKKPLF